MIYNGMYIFQPNSFAFNADVRRLSFSKAYEEELQSLSLQTLPAFRHPKVDTILEGGQKVIHKTYSAFDYVAGKDTVTIRDSLGIASAASKLVNLYDSYGIKPIWNQFDFIYFSTITISTVGYGDILPNSTTVRMIVVSEVLLGQVVLVVLLNFVLTDIRKGRQLTSRSS